MCVCTYTTMEGNCGGEECRCSRERPNTQLLAVSTTIPVVDPRAVPVVAVAAEEPVLQAPLAVQITPMDTGADVVARAPWSSSNDAASS